MEMKQILVIEEVAILRGKSLRILCSSESISFYNLLDIKKKKD